MVGLESSGPHSNGYSLIRKIFTERELKRYSKELLAPTRLYAKPVLALKRKVAVKGIANITGGAFYDKVPRIIPKNLAVEIDKYSWRVPPIFSLIQKRGNVDDREIYRTLNMGIGMVLAVAKRDAKRAVQILGNHGVKSHVIGRVVKGSREVTIL